MAPVRATVASPGIQSVFFVFMRCLSMMLGKLLRGAFTVKWLGNPGASAEFLGEADGAFGEKRVELLGKTGFAAAFPGARLGGNPCVQEKGPPLGGHRGEGAFRSVAGNDQIGDRGSQQ